MFTHCPPPSRSLQVDTGAAAALSNDVAAAVEPLGAFGVLLGLFLLTGLLASLVGPVPAVTLMFPVAMHLPNSATTPGDGNSVSDIIYVLMIAGSCCFVTPFSYASNLLVSVCMCGAVFCES